MIVIVLIVAILCMVIANYMWQREKNRREEEHERRMERFERLMEILQKQNNDQNPASHHTMLNSVTGVQESDTTKVDKNSKS